MRPLIQIIKAVLVDERHIPELPTEDLCLDDVEGGLVYREVHKELFLTVARLQTLIARQREIICCDRYFDLLIREDSTIGQSFFIAMSNVEAINEDADSVISMLEGLITECVRDFYSHEYDLCHHYRVDSNGNLYRKEVPSPCFTN